MEEQEDILCEYDGAPICLDCAEVQALCTDVSSIYYAPYNQHKLVFSFKVIEPEEHQGVALQMWAHMPGKWKSRPPLSSKLFKIIYVATGGVHKKGRVTKKLFIGKLYRCKVGKTKGMVPYSCIDMILERLA